MHSTNAMPYGDTWTSSRARRLGAMLGFVAGWLALASAALAAPSAAQLCAAAKQRASAQLAQCRLKADATFASRGDATKRDAAHVKCSAKLALAFAKADDQYGAACPSSGDASAVERYLIASTEKAREWSAGRLAAPFVFERTLASGQSTCWLGGTDSVDPIAAPCTGTGQDGETASGAAPSFVDNGDGTVTDQNTGLQWEKKSDDGGAHDYETPYYVNGVCSANMATPCTRDADCTTLGGTCSTFGFQTIYQAVDALNAAQFAGHDDWRVPNVRELWTTVDWGFSSAGALPVSSAFDDSCVPGCTSAACSCQYPAQLATSTSVRAFDGGTYRFPFVQFNLGVGGIDTKLSLYRLRAVRGGNVTADAPSGVAAGCEAAKVAAQASFALCRLRAEATFTKSGDATKRSDALATCGTKLAEAYGKAEAKFPGACATSADVNEVRAYHESAATRLVDWTTGKLAAPFTFERLSETGQDSCWLGVNVQVACAGTGQDGDARAGAALEFVDNGDGTISDRNTGLQWEKKSDDGSLHDKDAVHPWVGKCTANSSTWCTRDADCLLLGGTCGGTTAFEWIDQLNAASFAGHDDWRLPSARELESIVAHTMQDQDAPKIAAAFDANCGSDSSGNPGCTVTDCSCGPPSVYHSSTTVELLPAWNFVLDYSRGVVAGEVKNSSRAVRAVRGGS